MPQYELMYILSSAVADAEEPALTKQITEFIVEVGGEIQKVENLGKKKLAYPIKRTRNGLYVLINFKAPTDKIHEIDHKVRVTAGIIRHLLINLEESLIRQAKDIEEQKYVRRKRPVPVAVDSHLEAKKEPTPNQVRPKIKIDLDKQIEKALEEDITK